MAIVYWFRDTDADSTPKQIDAEAPFRLLDLREVLPGKIDCPACKAMPGVACPGSFCYERIVAVRDADIYARQPV